MTNDLYLPSGLMVYLIIAALINISAHAKAAHAKDTLLFGPTVMIRLIFIAIVFGFFSGAVYVAFETPPYPVGVVILGVISIIGTIGIPPNILVTSTDVIESKWWGKRSTIPWKDVSRILYLQETHETVVIGKSGTRVVHSGFNRDSNGFQEICKRRTGQNAILLKL
jgi:hypothetical protein